MKIRILLTTIGVAALAAIAINVSAGEALLTPRALGNQTKTVASGVSEVTPAMACVSHMSGNPKTIQACAEHPGTMPGCNPVTIAVK